MAPRIPWWRDLFRRVHPLVWWVLFLVVMLGALEVLIEWPDSLVDVVQVEQPAGWLIV